MQCQIPLLSRTSLRPSLLLLSTLATVLPPPTRTLYASTKAASLTLYLALIPEHPEITFTVVLPNTVAGHHFRSCAVDHGSVREKVTGVLEIDLVAKRLLLAVDSRERIVWLPWQYRYAHMLYWVWPTLIDRVACKKYNYTL